MTFKDFIEEKLLTGVLEPAITLLIVLATVVFMWGVIKFMSAGDSEEKRKSAKDTIIYGLLGLFVIVSAWALVGILTQTFLDTEVESSTPIPSGPLLNQ